MNPKSIHAVAAWLALAGWLGVGINSASARSVYFETYAQPVPIIEPSQVVLTPRYVLRRAVVTPPPIVREPTIVVSRPAYVAAPLVGPPMPPPYAVADW